MFDVPQNPNTLKQLETQITATDHQIDRLVYQLYELGDRGGQTQNLKIGS